MCLKSCTYCETFLVLANIQFSRQVNRSSCDCHETVTTVEMYCRTPCCIHAYCHNFKLILTHYFQDDSSSGIVTHETSQQTHFVLEGNALKTERGGLEYLISDLLCFYVSPVF